jgi:hypothetical protein
MWHITHLTRGTILRLTRVTDVAIHIITRHHGLSNQVLTLVLFIIRTSSDLALEALNGPPLDERSIYVECPNE